MGRGPKLELLGELSAEEASNVLDIAIEDRTSFSQLLPHVHRNSRRTFSFPVPALSLQSSLEVRIRDVPLLGSGLRVPPNFALDGRATSIGSRLSGWARIGWLPTRRLRLRIEDEKGGRGRTRTEAAALTGRGLPFSFNLRAAGLRGSSIVVSARLPDGRWLPLPDSPLLLERAVASGRAKPVRLAAWTDRSARVCRRARALERAASADVIIPVYRGREETLACIDSVLATIGDEARIIVVDDATDDAALAAALDELAAAGKITLLRNTQNQGFVASVNRALALHPTHDAVLLNSDTLVFADWLARLRAAAYSAASSELSRR